MHEKMSTGGRKRFLWRVLVSCFLVFDFFLFTTGNPSITYSIFGGWLWIPLIATVMIVASSAPGEGEKWSPFILHLFIVGILSVVLFAISLYAEEFAAAHLEAEIGSFVKDPINSKAEVSNEERQLMVKVESQKYSMKRETFIPTFRRMDYLFNAETGEKYRLIMTMSWNGASQVSFRRVES